MGEHERGIVVLATAVALTGCAPPPPPGIDPDLPEPAAVEGMLLYESALDRPEAVEGWIMEGPGELRFDDGGMEMFSPDEEFHHVLWNPIEFPSSFVAEWTVENLNLEEGLCIVFFAARGRSGEDIFDPDLPERDGTFTDYTDGAIDDYHISYYADGRPQPEREISHLRKNRGFHLVQRGEPGVPLNSSAPHRLRLVKLGAHIAMYVDDRLIINWIDEQRHGPVLGPGKIGLRQMRWTDMRYRDFAVWAATDG